MDSLVDDHPRTKHHQVANYAQRNANTPPEMNTIMVDEKNADFSLY
jgi:hypothetical protein